MYTGQELMYIINSGRLSKIHGQNIKLVFVHLNQTYNGIRTAPGGTAMFTLDNVSSAVLQKGQDPSGMGRWTFLTILGKK